jgi:hypothetical protein
VIVSLHVATGALLGSIVHRRAGIVLLGPLLHLVSDRVPHQDIPSLRFEVGTGAAGVLALAGRRGPLHPVTVGAIATCLPDAEHLVRLPRPGGRKLFPSHRFEGWHRAGGLPAWVQLAAAGLILGAILAARGKPRP